MLPLVPDIVYGAHQSLIQWMPPYFPAAPLHAQQALGLGALQQLFFESDLLDSNESLLYSGNWQDALHFLPAV